MRICKSLQDFMCTSILIALWKAMQDLLKRLQIVTGNGSQLGVISRFSEGNLEVVRIFLRQLYVDRF
jgi:hypothetical protein